MMVGIGGEGGIERARYSDGVAVRKEKGWVETAAKSLDEEGWKQRGGRWQRTAVATAVEAHEHHFY